MDQQFFKLSILIVNWNTEDLIGGCLDSIRRDPITVPYKVIVVDNGSTDESVAIIKNQYPWVRLLESRKNLGFAGGNNEACRHAVGKYILFLNPDTQVLPGAIETLCQFLESNAEVGAVGARLLNRDGTLQPSCYPAPTLLREFWRLFHLDRLNAYGSYDVSQWDTQEPRPVDAAMGACLMVKQEAIQQVGLFDERFFMYSEEVDLCTRLRHAGWKLFWVPQARVIHHGGQSTRLVQESMFLNLYRGKVLYFRKHHSWIYVQLYKLILLAASVTRLALTPLRWMNRRPDEDRYASLASNYLRLVVTLPSM